MCGVESQFSVPLWAKFLFFQTGPSWYFQLARAEQYLFEKAAKTNKKNTTPSFFRSFFKNNIIGHTNACLTKKWGRISPKVH